jgi:hypothetical protein
MGKKRGILLALAFVALLGGVVWMLSRPTEPVYQGKPLSAWLNEFNGWNTNQDAFVAFRELATNAVPALLKTIRSGDPPFQRLILKLNRMQTLVHFPLREAWQQRWAASFALCAMGAKAKPAFPALTNLLVYTNTAVLGAISLAGIGSEGLPPLLAALTNQNAVIRGAAATGLSLERSELNLVVRALVASLSDQDSRVHRAAVIALGRLHAEPELAVPALVKDFHGNDRVLRADVLEALVRFETNASAAVPLLLEALSDNDQIVRLDAARALKHIDPAAAAKAGVK